MRRGRSGCNVGSPPVREIPNVPSSLSFRRRSSSTCTGTGSLDLSYSEQYPHDRLQRRITTIWVRKGLKRRRKRILGAVAETAGGEGGVNTEVFAITTELGL